MPVTAGKLCQAMDGKLVRDVDNTVIKGVMCKCSRVVPGLLYFDVKGGRGGDRNILEAIQNGATGVVVSKYKRVLPFDDKNIVVISVPKVWQAFWQSLSFYRDLYDVPVVAVTGTSGKTTTKEMIASIFRLRWKTLKTVGNMNLPDFLPTHIMRLKWGYQAAVFEIGMNRPGHVSKQAKIVRPKVAIITNIGTGHIEHLGSPENVILEKAGIIQGIPDNGYLILNADDPSTGKIDISEFKGQIIYYGLDNKADFMAENITYTDKGIYFSTMIRNKNYRFYVPTFGRHNVYNALAAIAAATIFEFDPKTILHGLGSYIKPHMRLQIVRGPKNSTLINDTYNANPDSMIAGLEVLSTLSQGKTSVAVLGNMLEQGRYARESHRKVGQKAAELKVDWLITVGRLAKEIANGAISNTNEMKIRSFTLKNQALNFLKNNLPGHSVVLFKGSRGAYMEQLVRRLRDEQCGV